ncbi:hypothetical protein TIFTF001_004860 [Ficus carica]|uniref:Uncharacterized protein n=1 Tax=Ficus carica TaxID=3494 RepID=A0AA87ZZN0_FICCA|nr:hypothetical protein TIFTF001_004860 [Ficus carica]
MASIRCLHQWTVNCCSRFEVSTSKQTTPTQIQIQQPPILISRRCAVSLISSTLPFCLSPPSEARERRNKKTIPLEDYLTAPNGLKYYDVVEGKGPVAEKGSTVQVHFDCMYRGITALSSRESKLLAGNRIIAQPYEFKVGDPPGKERKREFVDNPNGLFSAQAAPKPPPALYSITEGMKVGGKVVSVLFLFCSSEIERHSINFSHLSLSIDVFLQRAVIVPPEVGYGKKGSNEIPAFGGRRLSKAKRPWGDTVIIIDPWIPWLACTLMS